MFSVISPLCGVAPTPDCGIIILHFPLEESFRHSFGTCIFIPHFPLEESFRHSFGTRINIQQFPLEASFGPSLGTQHLLSLCLIALVSLFICFMFAFVISYVRTVLRVLSWYSPGLLIWPDVDEGDFLDEEFDSASDA